MSLPYKGLDLLVSSISEFSIPHRPYIVAVVGSNKRLATFCNSLGTSVFQNL